MFAKFFDFIFKKKNLVPFEHYFGEAHKINTSYNNMMFR